MEGSIYIHTVNLTYCITFSVQSLTQKGGKVEGGGSISHRPSVLTQCASCVVNVGEVPQSLTMKYADIQIFFRIWGL